MLNRFSVHKVTRETYLVCCYRRPWPNPTRRKPLWLNFSTISNFRVRNRGRSRSSTGRCSSAKSVPKTTGTALRPERLSVPATECRSKKWLKPKTTNYYCTDRQYMFKFSNRGTKIMLGDGRKTFTTFLSA